jgi:hypothetical protein
MVTLRRLGISDTAKRLVVSFLQPISGATLIYLHFASLVAANGPLPKSTV